MECFYSIKESNFYVWEQFQIELVFGHQIAMATVERILLALQNEGAGGESLLGSIKIAVMPIVKVFTMCSLGLLMASKYVNILPASGRKLLNGVCNYVCMYVCVCLMHVACAIKFSLILLLLLAAGLYTLATLLDFLPIGTSCYFGEDACLVSCRN